MDTGPRSDPVYIAPEVADVDALHPQIRELVFREKTIREQLTTQANVVHQAHQRGDRRLRMQVMSWWPGARGVSLDDVMSRNFSLADARTTIANEHGFESWGEVEALGAAKLSIPFENALDVMFAGDHQFLEACLVAAPALVAAQSAFGHRATLLHYLGANGVESHRQRTPYNAAQLASILIAHGADINAKAHMYGGEQTPLALAATSAHPHNAGIADDLNQVLARGR